MRSYRASSEIQKYTPLFKIQKYLKDLQANKSKLFDHFMVLFEIIISAIEKEDERNLKELLKKIIGDESRYFSLSENAFVSALKELSNELENENAIEKLKEEIKNLDQTLFSGKKQKIIKSIEEFIEKLKSYKREAECKLQESVQRNSRRTVSIRTIEEEEIQTSMLRDELKNICKKFLKTLSRIPRNQELTASKIKIVDELIGSLQELLEKSQNDLKEEVEQKEEKGVINAISIANSALLCVLHEKGKHDALIKNFNRGSGSLGKLFCLFVKKLEPDSEAELVVKYYDLNSKLEVPALFLMNKYFNELKIQDITSFRSRIDSFKEIIKMIKESKKPILKPKIDFNLRSNKPGEEDAEERAEENAEENDEKLKQLKKYICKTKNTFNTGFSKRYADLLDTLLLQLDTEGIGALRDDAEQITIANSRESTEADFSAVSNQGNLRP